MRWRAYTALLADPGAGQEEVVASLQALLRLDGLATTPAGGACPPCRLGGPGKALWVIVEETNMRYFLFDMVGWRFMTKNPFKHHFLSTL